MRRPIIYVDDITDNLSREHHPNPEAVESPQSEPADEAAALEARRKRREAIRAKYRSQATPLHLKAVENIGEGETDTSTPGSEPASVKEASGMLIPDHLISVSKFNMRV